MSYPKKKETKHQEDGQCGCAYMDESTPCEIDEEAFNQCHDQFTKEIFKRTEVERLAENITLNTNVPYNEAFTIAQVISRDIRAGLEEVE